MACVGVLFPALATPSARFPKNLGAIAYPEKRTDQKISVVPSACCLLAKTLVTRTASVRGELLLSRQRTDTVRLVKSRDHLFYTDGALSTR